MRGKALDEKDRLAFEVIRDRAKDRSSSPEVGGVREWFEIDRLVEIVEKMQKSSHYAVIARWENETSVVGVFSDLKRAYGFAPGVEGYDSVIIEEWCDDLYIGDRYVSISD